MILMLLSAFLASCVTLFPKKAMIGDQFVIGFDQISDHPSDQTGDTNGSIRIRSISDGSPDIRFDRISEHTSTLDNIRLIRCYTDNPICLYFFFKKKFTIYYQQ